MSEPPPASGTREWLPSGTNPIEVAAAFVAAQDGGPDRILSAHVPNERGGCRSCSVPLRPVRWPCAPAAIALAAQDAPSGEHQSRQEIDRS